MYKERVRQSAKEKDDLLLLTIVTLFWFAQYVFVPFLSPHLTTLGFTTATGVFQSVYSLGMTAGPVAMGAVSHAGAAWAMLAFAARKRA